MFMYVHVHIFMHDMMSIFEHVWIYPDDMKACAYLLIFKYLHVHAYLLIFTYLHVHAYV